MGFDSAAHHVGVLSARRRILGSGFYLLYDSTFLFQVFLLSVDEALGNVLSTL